MVLRHLRYFATVAEEGSIVGAARKLRLAQPALSRQVQGLEREVGTPLIERERRGVTLTPAGAVLLAGANALFAKLELALRDMSRAHEGTQGALRLGLSRLALDSERVGRALGAVRKAYPGIQLVVTEVPALEQSRALREETLDFAVGLGDDEETSIKREALFEEVVGCAVLATSHPLARHASLTPAQLQPERFMCLRQSVEQGFTRLFDELRRVGITSWETYDSVDSVFTLVAAGRGWTLGPLSLRTHPPSGTAMVPIEGFRVPMNTYMKHRARDGSRLVANVVQALRKAAADENGARRTSKPEPVARQRRPSSAVPLGLELRQLSALIAAADEGSLSRAASRLALTQSGVSRRVRALEQEVGVRLLQRLAHGVVATPAGEALRTHAGDVLRLADDAIARARRAAGGNRGGACRIAALPAELTGTLLVNALTRVEERYPDMRLEVEEMMPEAQLRALLEGKIDVGVAGGFRGLSAEGMVASVTLVDDTVDCVMVAAGHPWASRAWVTAAELATEPFVFVSRAASPKFYEVVIKSFEAIGLTVSTAGTYDGPRAVWRVVAGSTGWTLGSRSQRSSPPSGLVPVPVEGLNIPWGIQLLWRREESDPHVRQVLDVFRESRNQDVAVVVATMRASRGPAALTP